MSKYPLNSLGYQIKAHWERYLPRMVRELKEKGELEEALYSAQEMTGDAIATAIEQGMAPDQARELYREEWAFLPSEEDMPELGWDPAELSPPPPSLLSEQGSRSHDVVQEILEIELHETMVPYADRIIEGIAGVRREGDLLIFDTTEARDEASMRMIEIAEQVTAERERK